VLNVKNNGLRLLMLVLMAIAIAGIFYYRDQLDIAFIQHRVEQAGAAAPLVFILLYALGTVLFFPGSLLTLLGGALFGPVMGAFYNLTGATAGAALAFFIARYMASDWVQKKTGGKLKRLLAGVENEGWRFVAFVRLVPLFPFNLLNYALGLTRIRFSHYLIASYIFMLPGAVAYTYLGYIGKEAATGGESLVRKTMLALALLGLVAFLPRLVSSIRKGDRLSVKSLKQRIDRGGDFLLLDVRMADDYYGEQGHIEGSTLIPLDQLETRLDEINDYYEKTIVTICRTDRKSAKAAQLLSDNGFADVHVVKQGMTDWLKNNFPVVKAAER